MINEICSEESNFLSLLVWSVPDFTADNVHNIADLAIYIHRLLSCMCIAILHQK
jgi:hypothetical protein